MNIRVMTDLGQRLDMTDGGTGFTLRQLLEKAGFRVNGEVRVQVNGERIENGVLDSPPSIFYGLYGSTIYVTLHYKDNAFFRFDEFEIFNAAEAKHIVDAYTAAGVEYTMQHGIRDGKPFWHFKK